ncbi:DUF2828 family protein [Faecalibacillus intestinalis]|uniref:DUF2828 family protein n=1 Tax=Faecalibacillus intestinalis TaxID=1982626 RepID=UPI00399212DB
MITDLKNELSNTKQLTENGAVGYMTTGKELLDLNFKTSSLRNKSEDEIFKLFLKAFHEDKLLAIKWLFFMRDAREGMGERRSFRIILNGLGHQHPTIAKELISLVPEYGRWDDLYSLMDGDLTEYVVDFIYQQLQEDCGNYLNKKPISLLAKWLPKESTKKYKKVYNILLKKFGMTPKEYRRIISDLRKYLDVVEVKMSANEWNKVNYNTIPSKANLLYKDAFLRHDKERRNEYLNDLKNGNNNAKINAKVLMPHEIVHRYMDKYEWGDIDDFDESLEQLWKALPNYVNSEGFSMFVRDGSYSMTTKIGNTNITCLDISTALAIYFSEHCKGEYKDNFITFSNRPKVIDLSNCSSLREKIEKCHAEDDCSNTDIYKVFKLILDTAVNNKYTQEQLPKNIVVVSDMEFDDATTTSDYQTLFETIQAEYLLHGYDLPRLVFWNVCSRTGAIPLKTNKNGVCLVSGFNPTIMDMVLSGELDPYKCLVNKLNSSRYDAVEKAVKNLLN